MNKKKKKILYLKLTILVLCFFIVIRLITLILARYESEANAIANVDVAFYLLKEDFRQMNLKLDSIFPENGKHVYTFSVGNCDGTKNAEVDLEYELTIRTTTNLPITYSLYMNEEYTDANAESIFTSNEIAQDEYGTYFRTMKTQKVALNYTDSVTNIYQLVVQFPENYNSENYQDIIELIEITVEGKQVTS